MSIILGPDTLHPSCYPLSRITSYINNLHPVEYKGLYGLIERVTDAAIPLWNLTLGDLEYNDWFNYLRIHYHRSYNDLIEQPEPDVFKPPTEPEPTFNLQETELSELYVPYVL